MSSRIVKSNHSMMTVKMKLVAVSVSLSEVAKCFTCFSSTSASDRFFQGKFLLDKLYT